MSTTIQTKFGNASVDAQGYYVIHSNEKGNRGKKLHRLIFEDFYQTEIPEGWIIHHEDGDKLNNNIWNLVPMTHTEHSSIHSCVHTEESKRKLRLAQSGKNNPNYGKPRPMERNIKNSKKLNTTGYYRVIKQKGKQYSQGFIWTYNYYVDGKRKRISSMDIEKLKEKVEEKGLEWFKIDGEKDEGCNIG